MPQFKGGIESVVEMFALLDGPARDRLLRSVAEKDPELARKIQDQLFTFEDLKGIAPKELQLLLREVPSAKLLLAMRKVSPELKQAILSNMSARAAKSLEEDLGAQSPKRVSEIEQAQREIIELARGLESKGKILLRKA
jgi:flagellar motor switch protein FliG